MKIAKLGLILFAITVVAAGILGFANEKTAVLIEKVNEDANNESRQQVLPEADEFKELESNKLKEIQTSNPEVLDIYEGIKGGEVIGYTIKTGTNGYGGIVEVITGINKEEKIIEGVRLGNNNETPGLGALATEESFYGQYDKKPSEELEVVKSAPGETDILAITGATITSKAVTSGVNLASEVFAELDK
ncbi:MAG: RnfABCDGE type electron transport complex subunit G [Andreesenia angusta]|nr:RnfABCDGE type electron transport complex subunit G [Andreesenia angusta]